MRKKLPSRRYIETHKITHATNDGSEQSLIVSYGVNDGQVQEVFCSSFKVGSDMMSLAIDASILLSRCLQHGDTLEELHQALCSPESIIGTLAKAGLCLEEKE